MSKKEEKVSLFPNLTDVIGKDKLRPVMMHAVVINGYLMAINSYSAAIIHKTDFVKSKEELNNIENKVFNIKLIKKLIQSKITNIFFGSDFITIYYKDKHENIPYTGYINDNGEIVEVEHLTKKENIIGRYPNIKSVVEYIGYDSLDENKLEDVKYKLEKIDTRLPLNAKILEGLAKALCVNKDVIVENLVKRYSVVPTRFKKGEPIKAYGIMMPIVLKQE